MSRYINLYLFLPYMKSNMLQTLFYTLLLFFFKYLIIHMQAITTHQLVEIFLPRSLYTFLESTLLSEKDSLASSDSQRG